jgi:hypothetical protein
MALILVIVVVPPWSVSSVTGATDVTPLAVQALSVNRERVSRHVRPGGARRATKESYGSDLSINRSYYLAGSLCHRQPGRTD